MNPIHNIRVILLRQMNQLYEMRNVTNESLYQLRHEMRNLTNESLNQLRQVRIINGQLVSSRVEQIITELCNREINGDLYMALRHGTEKKLALENNLSWI